MYNLRKGLKDVTHQEVLTNEDIGELCNLIHDSINPKGAEILVDKLFKTMDMKNLYFYYRTKYKHIKEFIAKEVA